MKDTHDNSRPDDWVELVARIRAGDEEAELRVADIFQSGIRFFLGRALGQHKLERREREVLSLVIKSIRETSADNPNHLASHVLTILHQYISSQTTAGPHLVIESESRVNVNDMATIQELVGKVSAVDREALRRYYVDKETSEQVCQALGITSAKFQALRGIRTAFKAARGT